MRLKRSAETIQTERYKEKIFFIAYIMFLIGIMINISKFSDIEIIKKSSHIFQILSCGIAMIKVLLDFKEHIQNKSKLNLGIIIILVIMIVSFFVTKEKTIVFFATFIIAAKNIDFKKIARVTLKTKVLCLIFIIISSQLGIIENLKIYRVDKIRQSLGTSSPNCLMLQVFQIMILYLYTNRDKIKLYNIIVILGISMIFYNITDSRMGMLAIILVVLAFEIVKINKIKSLINKMKIFFKYFTIILFVIIITLTFVYKEFNATKINAILSNRLYLNSRAIDKYGINLLGSEIKWVGQTDSFREIDNEYNYIDCSYLRILLNNGIIIFGFVLYCMIKLMNYSYNKNDYFLIILLLIIQFYCLLDSWLIAIQFNTFLFLLTDSIYPFKIENNKIGEKE